MKKRIKKAGIALAIGFILIGAYLYFFNISPAARLPQIEDMVSIENLQAVPAFNLSFLVTTKKIYSGTEKIQGYAVSPTHRNKTATLILIKDGTRLYQHDYLLDSYGLFLFNLPNFGEGVYLALLEIDGERQTFNYFLVTEPGPQRFSTDILRVYWHKDYLNVWGIIRRDGMPFQGHLKAELFSAIKWVTGGAIFDLARDPTLETLDLQPVNGNFNIRTVPKQNTIPGFPSLFMRIWYNEKENSLIPILRPEGEKKISDMGDEYWASLDTIPQAEDFHGFAIRKIAKTNSSPWRLDFPVGNKIRIRAVAPLEKAVVHVLDPITLNINKFIIKRPKDFEIAPSYPLSLVDIYARSKTREYFDYAVLIKEVKTAAKMELGGKLKAGGDLEVLIESQKPSEGILIISRAAIERENLDDLLGNRIICPAPVLFDCEEGYWLPEVFSGSNALDLIPTYAPMNPLSPMSFKLPFPPPPPSPIRFWAKRKRDGRSLPKAVDVKEAAGIVFFEAFPIDKSVRKFIKMPPEPGTWKAEIIVYYQNEYRFDRIEKSFKTSNQSRSK